MARVSVFFFFFQTNQSLKKNCFLFEGECKGGLANVSEFVLQRAQI